MLDNLAAGPIEDDGQLDGYDNRAENLRAADQTMNNANARMRTDNMTGFKCVLCRGCKFVSSIKFRGKKRHLGTFDAPEAAHECYMAEARKVFGSFARAA